VASLSADHATVRQFFENSFTPCLAKNRGDPTGLFTGYYEASLRGAWSRKGLYQVPIYRRPEDLVTVDLGQYRDDWKGQNIAGRNVGDRLIPYPTRADIETGALAGRGLELLWVDNAADAFFLHVQGSGRVAMDDGREVRLGYAGSNGHPFVGIGQQLVNQGSIPREGLSMQAIRAWIKANPTDGTRLMRSNPSFIFFKINDGPGPIGSQGTPLTAGRSIAVDPQFVPLGQPLWLDTTDPIENGVPLRRLVIAQDSGSAIKGPIRGDLFWGHGERAAEKAGAMKQTGRYILFLPKRYSCG
jgi:membrane-bound lytic murein transglycosylase A